MGKDQEVKNRFTGNVIGKFDISPGANLRGANLSEANLRGANLRGADIDFSCWPLWCGTVEVIYGKRLTKQHGAHWLINALPVLEANNIPVSDELIDFLNGFHRIQSGEFPKIERKK